LRIAIFGDFKDMRNAGFINDILMMLSLTSTYINAYQFEEDEYVEDLVKRNIH